MELGSVGTEETSRLTKPKAAKILTHLSSSLSVSATEASFWEGATVLSTYASSGLGEEGTKMEVALGAKDDPPLESRASAMAAGREMLDLGFGGRGIDDRGVWRDD